MKNTVIAIDFDGTVVEHAYPLVGQDVPDAVISLKYLQGEGAKLILWTMRSGNELNDAVDWFDRVGVPLFGVNENPEQFEWSKSPKAYATFYIDDAAVGCPLLYPDDKDKRPMVDWKVVLDMLLHE